MLGVMETRSAIRDAKDRGLDLVEVSPTADPPVCKYADFGKYKFNLQRKEHDNRKKQKVVQIKEIKLRPTIDDHDYQVKLRSIIKFINAGNKVKISLKFRGREITHKEFGMDVINKIIEDTKEIARTEFEPKMDGKQILMVIGPKAS